MSWQDAAGKAQAAVKNAIPSQWRLPSNFVLKGKDVRSVPRDCGLLSQKQLEITERTATELVEELRNGRLSSVTVTTAYVARAAIAAQVTNCIANFFPQEGLQRAAELDEYLRKHGKPMGPLHGLPIALKVSQGLHWHSRVHC